MPTLLSKAIQDLDRIPELHRKRAHLAVQAVEESAEKRIKVAEKYMEVLEEKIRNLTVELSHVRAVFATRPLLELGLAKFQETNPHLAAANTWTSLSQSFLSDVLFEDDGHLQDWAKGKMKRLNKLFSWQIQWDDARFENCLWNLYQNFSEKYHEVSSEDTGFMISGASQMETAAAALFVCGLCGRGAWWVVGLRFTCGCFQSLWGIAIFLLDGLEASCMVPPVFFSGILFDGLVFLLDVSLLCASLLYIFFLA
ncbi:unnamed protein product, partial [Symbiodinium sp. KB8]